MTTDASRIYSALRNLKRIRQMFPPGSDMPPGEHFLLHRIWELEQTGEATHVTDLSGCMHVSLPAVSQLVNQLEKKGLVRREMSSGDRRKVTVLLTDAGRQTQLRAHERSDRLMRELSQRLGEADTQTLVRLLERLGDIADQLAKEQSMKE